MIRAADTPTNVIEAMAERNARLVVRLQRTSEAYHRSSGHAAARWIACPDTIGDLSGEQDALMAKWGIGGAVGSTFPALSVAL
jgi:hypothetical protein